ncbi:hypothetical protein BOX15_Mlig028894g1 [Macrostomum lignano]|uniref:Uncharacterized protein n=1 Tax=Macrostomum lignano TaxID=282301 RepID=A0A267GSB0_9PLAT|nr:hypothetical protein BOX15_Mlig028894g2 [Macrostomum lignano]PAA88314.1 hypothetical protein BOX15_Mlig028894g1 [Macrostomum lignano]
MSAWLPVLLGLVLLVTVSAAPAANADKLQAASGHRMKRQTDAWNGHIIDLGRKRRRWTSSEAVVESPRWRRVPSRLGPRRGWLHDNDGDLLVMEDY